MSKTLPDGVKVKNTFIDFDQDAPAEPDLRRAKSETAARAGIPEDDEEASASASPTACSGSSPSAIRGGGRLPEIPGPRWVVRNTFFECVDDDAAPPPGGVGLVRARTDTQAYTQTRRQELDEQEEERNSLDLTSMPPHEEEDLATDAVTDLTNGGAFEDLDAPAPSEQGLNRTVTWNQEEVGMHWQWPGQVPDQRSNQMPPMPQEVLQPQILPQQMQPGTQRQFPMTGMGYMMVAMTQGPMMANMMPQMPMASSHCSGSSGDATCGSAPTPTTGAPSAPAPALNRIATPGEPPQGAPSGQGQDEGGDLAAPPDFSLGAESVPLPPVLARTQSVTQPHVQRVRWRIDARKLKATDREHVSPVFSVQFARDVQFKVVIRPKAIHESRGGNSFKKAKGRGTVELRCLEKLDSSLSPVVMFRIGASQDGASGNFRGEVRHDFSERSICGLPKDEEEWNFTEFVNEQLQSFFVCVEIITGAAAVSAQ